MKLFLGLIVCAILAGSVVHAAVESADYLAVKAAFAGSPTAMPDAKKLKRSVDGYQNVVPGLDTNNEVRDWLATKFAAEGWIEGAYPDIDDLFELRIPASDTPLTEPERVTLNLFLRDVKEAAGAVVKGL